MPRINKLYLSRFVISLLVARFSLTCALRKNLSPIKYNEDSRNLKDPIDITTYKNASQFFASRYIC